MLLLPYSEQANVLLLAVSLPLLEGFPISHGHANNCVELFVAQVVLFLSRSDARREAGLEHLVGELVAGGVELAGEGIVSDGSGCGSNLALFLGPFGNDSGVSLEPLLGDLRLPLDELNGERGRLTTSENFLNNHIVLVTSVTALGQVLLGALDDTGLLELVGLVADPSEDGVVGIKDVTVFVEQIFLSESGKLFHPHVSRGVGNGEKAGLEARCESGRLLDLAVLALSADGLPEGSRLGALLHDLGGGRLVDSGEKFLGSSDFDFTGANTLPDVSGVGGEASE